VREAGGESNWIPFVETIARAMKPGAENQVSFSEIRIQDGELKYEDAHNHTSESLGDIDLSLAWPSISRSFAATGQFDWRGERIDGSVSASDFVALLSGERSGLKARLASAPLKLAFDGTVANRRHRPPARLRRARLEPAIVRPHRAVDDRSRHAPVGRQGDGGPVQARPHRARGKFAQRRAGALHRRGADVWRHRQGLAGHRA